MHAYLISIFENINTLEKNNTKSARIEQILNPFLQALDLKKVSENTDQELKIIISEIIKKALFDLGYKKKGIDDHTRLCDAVLEILEQHFPFLTIGQVKLACKRGSYGIYGDVSGVFPAQIYKWISEFQIEIRTLQAIYSVDLCYSVLI